MTRILIRQCRIHGGKSPAAQDILIENGRISRISDQIDADGNDRVIEAVGLTAIPGLLDLNCFGGEPGLEHREDFVHLQQAAARGGFTRLCLMPNTEPVLHARPEIEYIIRRSEALAVELLPIGAISVNTAGEQMAEMLDMRQAGAVAFSDGNKGVANSGIVERALLYTRQFNGLVMVHPEDTGLTAGRQMHEGIAAAQLGLEGIPSIAEELGVYREIQLARYTGGRLHLLNLSTAGSIELVRNAKAEGLEVTASVNAYNLLFNENDLLGFDTNLKVNPPVRSLSDVDACRSGLLDGTIDAISSGHTPWDAESKEVEFLYAQPGMIGLETALSIAFESMGADSLDLLVEKFSRSARRILGLPAAEIAEGTEADLALLDPEAEWTVKAGEIASKARNTPLINRVLPLRIRGIVLKDQYIIH